MATHKVATQTVSRSDAPGNFGGLVDEVVQKGTRVVVEDDGRPVAALVSTADLDRLNRLDGYREDPWSVIEEIHARNKDKDPEEVERDVAEAIAEVRRER